MKTGQIVLTITENENDISVQTKSDDFSSAETASYLFLALMSTYNIDEEESKQVFKALNAAIDKVIN